MALKSDIRKAYKNKRLQLNDEDKIAMEDLIALQFELINILVPNILMTYAPIESKKEYNPKKIIDHCKSKNTLLKIAYPLMCNQNEAPTLQAIEVNDNTNFLINQYEILEPTGKKNIAAQDINVVIVPLLAVDINGNRVGYGKGYYDRFLQTCSKDCIKIGCGFFDVIDIIDDIESTDIELNFYITPKNIYQF
jgi:5-formyltetrahydrofolate cyclo-ligase